MATDVEPIYRYIGSKIQELRGDSMTQKTLGQLLEPAAKRASIANMENGKQRIFLHTILQIAEIFEVDLEEIIPKPQKSESEITEAVKKELRKKLKMSSAKVKKMENVIRSTEAA